MTLTLNHRLWFIRHGETDFNREGRLQGQQDTPLNAKGREQASAVGRSLARLAGAEMAALNAKGAFLASPFGRTRRTMELARTAMGFDPSAYALDDRLKELTFGDWEGFTWSEIADRDAAGAAARAAAKWDFTPPNGESYAALARRVTPWVESLEHDLFVTSHGGVARALMYLIGGLAPEKAADAAIQQGRAILFAGGRFEWVG